MTGKPLWFISVNGSVIFGLTKGDTQTRLIVSHAKRNLVQINCHGRKTQVQATARIAVIRFLSYFIEGR